MLHVPQNCGLVQSTFSYSHHTGPLAGSEARVSENPRGNPESSLPIKCFEDSYIEKMCVVKVMSYVIHFKHIMVSNVCAAYIICMCTFLLVSEHFPFTSD